MAIGEGLEVTLSGPSAYVRFRLPFQSVIATHAAKRSAGVSNPSVLRGLPLSCRATSSKRSCECTLRLVRLEHGQRIHIAAHGMIKGER